MTVVVGDIVPAIPLDGCKSNDRLDALSGTISKVDEVTLLSPDAEKVRE